MTGPGKEHSRNRCGVQRPCGIQIMSCGGSREGTGRLCRALWAVGRTWPLTLSERECAGLWAEEAGPGPALRVFWNELGSAGRGGRRGGARQRFWQAEAVGCTRWRPRRGREGRLCLHCEGETDTVHHQIRCGGGAGMRPLFCGLGRQGGRGWLRNPQTSAWAKPRAGPGPRPQSRPRRLPKPQSSWEPCRELGAGRPPCAWWL